MKWRFDRVQGEGRSTHRLLLVFGFLDGHLVLLVAGRRRRVAASRRRRRRRRRAVAAAGALLDLGFDGRRVVAGRAVGGALGTVRFTFLWVRTKSFIQFHSNSAVVSLTSPHTSSDTVVDGRHSTEWVNEPRRNGTTTKR